MTPGYRAAPGVFCFAGAADWSYVAADLDCGLWRGGHAGALRAAGHRAGARGGNVPLRHAACQSERMLFAWAYWTVHAEPPSDLSRLARGHRGGVFRRLYNLFQFWLGDRE